MASGGVKGKSGRKGYGLEQKQGQLKDLLLLAVLEDCQTNPKRKLFWAEKFSNKLLPNDLALPANSSGSISIKWE